MRIALFYNLPAGGAKRALYEHARHLRKRGHVLDAYILSSAVEEYLPLGPVCENVYSYDVPTAPGSPSPGPGQRLARGLKVTGVAVLRRMLGPRRGPYLAEYQGLRQHVRELDALQRRHQEIAADMDRRGYDVAYVHQCIVTQSPYLLRFLKCPSVYYCQDTMRYVYEWSLLEHERYDVIADGRYVKRRLGTTYTLPALAVLGRKERDFVRNTRSATQVLANSWYSREAILRTTGVNPRVCYLGVDSDFFCPDFGVAREPMVLSVGMLMPHKRHDFVIEALATLPAARRPRLEIIGYEMEYGKKELGPVGQRLLRLAEERGVEVTIQRDVSDEALRAAYRRASVVAFAPYLEPFGFVSLEAMACGTPVVGVSEGGVRETVQQGVTGLLTDRDPEAFGDAVDRILGDRKLAAQMGRDAREAAACRWTWERSVDTVECCFEKVTRLA